MTYYPPEVPRQIEIPDYPLQHLLESAACQHPDAVATTFFGATMTYSRLEQEANRFAHGLIDMGVAPGDRVAIHLPNSPQFLICLFGTLKAGAVATLASPLHEVRELAYQLNDSGARVLVTLSRRDILKRARAAREDSSVERLIVTSIKDCFSPSMRLLFTLFKEKKEGHRAELDAARGEVWFESVLERKPDETPGVRIDAGSAALLQYTGGTTGLPKAAELTHRNLVANALQSRAWLHNMVDARERVLVVLPLFHVYALTSCMLAISRAASLILLPRFDLAEVLKTIDRERPTLFPGIPAMYAAINHSLERDRADGRKKIDLSSIHTCVSGADKLPREIQQEFEELSGGRVVEGYGLTEASPVTHVNPIAGMRKTGSIGLPLPNTEVRIVDIETGEDLPTGEIGEMLVRGPQVMRGYWGQAALSEDAFADGDWLRTGDMASVDEDGFYFIADRRKDLIITGGLNVYPREIEEVLGQFHKISEVAVKGVPHKLKGEIVKAYIVLKDNEKATASEIRNFAQEKLAGYKVPNRIEFRSELPRNILRKVLKRELGNDGDDAEDETPRSSP
ncbi:MAG: long-chain fatty acid--CoA ligase [Gaiellales bacterium]|nr:MAG: long-chain fatty acid--CoA ligase [Gaiellales bacterium]